MRAIWICICLCLLYKVTSQSTSNKLLLLIVDGLPWKKISQGNELPSFAELRNEGTTAQYMKPVFPSVGYPNYFSLLTGLYPEEHGLVDEYMHDYRDTKSFFVKGASSGENDTGVQWFQKGELFWTTAQNQGRLVGVYGWSSCNHSDMAVGPKPDLCYPSLRDDGWEASFERVDQAITQIEEDAIDIGIVFVSQLDHAARSSGINSREYNCSLDTVDHLISYTRGRIENASLSESVNLIILSTHGLSSPLRPPLVVDISRYSEDVKRAVTFLPGGSRVVIYPQEGTTARLFNSLYRRHEHLQVYWKWTMPLKWRIRNGYFTAPLLVIADEGWAVASSKKEALFLASSRGAYDGYDPDKSENMRGVFLAIGPDFKSNYTHSSISITDVYNLLCRAVGVQPSNNSGQWSNVVDMLDNGTKPTDETLVLTVTPASLPVVPMEGSGEMEAANLTSEEFIPAKTVNHSGSIITNATGDIEISGEGSINATDTPTEASGWNGENGPVEASGDGSGEEEGSGEVENNTHRERRSNPGVIELVGQTGIEVDLPNKACKCIGELCTAESNQPCQKEQQSELKRQQPTAEMIEDGQDAEDDKRAEVHVHDWRETLANITRKNRRKRNMEEPKNIKVLADEDLETGSGEHAPVDSSSPTGQPYDNRSGISIRFNNRHPHAHHGLANIANVRSHKYDLRGSIMVQNGRSRPEPSSLERMIDLLRPALSRPTNIGDETLPQNSDHTSQTSAERGRLRMEQFVSGGEATQLIVQQPVVNILLMDSLEPIRRTKQSDPPFNTGKDKVQVKILDENDDNL